MSNISKIFWCKLTTLPFKEVLLRESSCSRPHKTQPEWDTIFVGVLASSFSFSKWQSEPYARNVSLTKGVFAGLLRNLGTRVSLSRENYTSGDIRERINYKFADYVTDMVGSSRVKPSLFGKERRPDPRERRKSSLSKTTLVSRNKPNVTSKGLETTGIVKAVTKELEPKSSFKNPCLRLLSHFELQGSCMEQSLGETLLEVRNCLTPFVLFSHSHV